MSASLKTSLAAAAPAEGQLGKKWQIGDRRPSRLLTAAPFQLFDDVQSSTNCFFHPVTSRKVDRAGG
jgi:hypothetical protein